MLLGVVLVGVGCGAHEHRFVPVGTDMNVALDTKTGRICDTRPDLPGVASELPRCFDLYRQ